MIMPNLVSHITKIWNISRLLLQNRHINMGDDDIRENEEGTGNELMHRSKWWG